ncbi:MAG: hypothetical protein Q9219_004238 [cf. Caloplaca sp. 3 TL-2023]
MEPLISHFRFSGTGLQLSRSWMTQQKGDDNTFGGFPEHLRALVSHALPKITVKAVTYPRFETRGDLGYCVSRLQNVVIDLEVSAGTPSPTIDPSVRTVLVGHSMGGIVAAETLLNIISDEAIPPKPPPDLKPSTVAHTNATSTSTSLPQANAYNADRTNLSTDGPHVFMFPYIQGILAFDTPYLGISPSVIAHGAENHYRSASSAYSAVSNLAGAFGYGPASSPSSKQVPQPKAALPPAPEHAKDVLSASDDAAATPTWQRLGKYAMFAGAAGAVAAGGAAAYLKKDALSSGWNWVGSHLEFVGCLVRGEELKNRLEKVVALNKERAVGFADLYTVLGKGAGAGGAGEEKRTFCNVPRSKPNRELWWGEVNEKAREETGAHMSMFLPRENPGYYAMGERAKGLVVGWVEGGGWNYLDRDDDRSEDEVIMGEGGGMEDVDVDEEGVMDFGIEKEEGVLWGGDGRQAAFGGEENPWKMEGEKGLEGEESVIVERR